MKKYCYLVTMLILSGMAFAETPTGVSSGLIAYSCMSDGAKYLLAYDPEDDRRAWGAFGGGAQGNETSRQTAIREFHEETNCAYSRATLETSRLHGPSVYEGFYSYVIEVPYVDPAVIEITRQCQDVERSFWVWVPHSALITALNSQHPEPYVKIKSKPMKKFYLWDGAAESLRAAKNNGFISNNDPCELSKL